MKINDRTATITQPSIPRPPLVREQWEYRSRRMEIDADLSQFGAEGWELISVVPILHDSSMCSYYFKRRRF